MKKIFAVIVAIGILPAFWAYYFKEKPEIRYSISSAIPINFLSVDKSESANPHNDFVQLIEVANSGNAPASKIAIKLPNNVIQSDVAKHTATELVEIFRTKDGIEIKYNELTPSAKFQVTLRSKSNPVSENQLQVSHQNGTAKIVSAETKSDNSFLSILSALAPFVFILLSITTWLEEARYKYVFRTYSPDVTKLLQNNKPFYVREKDWPRTLIDLLNRALSEPIDSFTAIAKLNSYKLLNSQKPEEITLEKWSKLQEIATKQLADTLIVRAERVSNIAEILDSMSIVWPVELKQASRENIEQSISRIYCEKILKRRKVEELLRALREPRPQKISANVWEDFKYSAQKLIVIEIATKLFDGENVDALINESASTIEFHNQHVLNRLMQGHNAKYDAEKALKEAEDLHLKISIAQTELATREIKCKLQEEQNAASRKRVKRQLEVINMIINDPTYLSRVEPDDDTFVEGNWTLLKRLTSARA